MPSLHPSSSKRFLLLSFVLWLGSESTLNITAEDRHFLCDASVRPFEDAKDTRIRWVHVPKTGTSFANTVWHYGCRGLPENVSVAAYNRRFEGEINDRYPLSEWCPHLADHTPGTHKPIGVREWAEHRGNFVGFLREPSKRLLSAFSFSNHHCIKDCNTENTHLMKCNTIRDPSRRTSEECQQLHSVHCPTGYAKNPAAQGCATKMLLGYPCNANVALSQADQELAIQRIRDGFSFVGLVEEWDLSLCMFHRLLGGTPLLVESAHVRGNEHDKMPAECHVTEVDDAIDKPLYAAAREMFERQVHTVLQKLRADPLAPKGSLLEAPRNGRHRGGSASLRIRRLQTEQ